MSDCGHQKTMKHIVTGTIEVRKSYENTVIKCNKLSNIYVYSINESNEQHYTDTILNHQN